MPVATAKYPSSSRPANSSPLASSSSSLSNSITLSQAKHHYNHAARSFLHRRHEDALLASEKALQAFQTEHLRDQGLAERLLILRLTLLATVYRPQKAERIDVFNQVKKAGKMSAKDQTIVIALEALLSLPPLSFLARLWTEILRFYIDVLPRVQSISSRAPSISAPHITAEADTLSSALQLPAGVVAAAIMGALRIDDESKPRDEAIGVRGKKQMMTSRPTSEANMSEGLQSARAMCEWVMSAHSKLAGTYSSFSPSERKHLYQQYIRVLELYTLHILGTRLDQWELAQQVARCAVEIREDEEEMRDRQALLDQLTSAQIHLSTRGERRRIASEKARQRYEEEKVKRAASAEHQIESISGDVDKKENKSNAIPLSSPTSLVSTASSSPILPKLRRSNSGLSTASSSTSASEMESEGGIPSRRKAREASKGAGDYAEKRGHISNQIDRHHKRSPLSGDEKDAQVAASRGRRVASSRIVQDQILNWMRNLSSNPYVLIRYLSALVAALFIIKRAITPSRSTSNMPKRVGAATETTRSRLEQAKRQDESLIVTAARKVWSTLRMGTQVTYL